MARRTHCKRGHRYTAATIRLKKLTNGYTVRECKLCESFTARVRYHRDPLEREKRRAATRLAYGRRIDTASMRAGQ